MEFVIRVRNTFIDKNTGEPVEAGDIFTTKDKARAEYIINQGLGILKKIKSPGTVKIGSKTTVFYNYMAPIGGIETSIIALAKSAKNTDTTFFFKKIDFENAIRIGKYCNVEIYLSEDARIYPLHTDVLIIEGFDGYEQAKPLFIAKKIYQLCHADWIELKKYEGWKNFEWKIDDKIDKVVSVSETARNSLKKAFSSPIDSVVVPNCPSDVPNPLTLLTLSRLTKEKGGRRILEIIKELEAKDIDYLWFIASPMEDQELAWDLLKNRRVISISPDMNRRALLRRVDYLVQLSDTESYCYSVREALSVGTPVIATRIPEFNKLIKNGENGYLVKLDLSDLNVRKIAKEIPKPKPRKDKVDSRVSDMLQGEL